MSDSIEVNKIYCENCLVTMERMPDYFLNLTVTSPPYDDLRTYTGESQWDEDVWKAVIEELFRVTKQGGAVVWIVGDSTYRGSRTGTSFKQALWAMECGFNLHDTMIWNKGKFSAVGSLKTRYAPVFEYMFVFVKGTLRVFNPIKDRKNITAGQVITGNVRQVDGSMKPKASIGKITAEYGQRFNIWKNAPQQGKNIHPAPFPEQIANDHIISWCKEGNLVYDPFMGSGTTAKMALLNNRRFIGSEISRKYYKLAMKRIRGYMRKH